ncbi:GNAT family N-acetyltransferase [Halobacillus seohaensis]|uniref:GNAT family N-acetyltransferase n=1 Tax=Halobacillus seohaensis TaxID=447421 RepID=A0ABW2ESA1_9BACI
MSKNTLLDIFHKELRVQANALGYKRIETNHVVKHISEHNEAGFILASNLDGTNARKVIRDQVDYFKELGQRFEWKVYSYDKPDNLMEILIEEGFEAEEREALMVLEITENTALLYKPVPLHLVEISGREGIGEIISLLDEIWNESHAELGERLWRDKQNDTDSLFLYGIYEDDHLVSAAWMYFEMNSSFASLWGGATRTNYRGKGYYTSLLTARAKKALEKGYGVLTVDARPMSRPILEKDGFVCLAYTYGLQSPALGSE